MRKYELMVIVNPDIGSDAINAKLEEIRKMVASQKGEVFFEDLWGLRDLAYRIKKKDRGYYAVFDLNMESSGLKEINTTLKIDNDILRHLLVSLPEEYEAKSLIEAEKEADIEAGIEEVTAAPKKPAKAAPATPRKEAVKEPAKEEKVEAAKEPAAPKASLEDVDKKLSNLLDNPDLNF